MKNYKKLLLIPVFAFLLLSLANAESDNSHANRSNLDREDMVQEIFGKVDKEDLKLYTNFTNNSELNQKIKALRENYQDKIEALRKQYVVDLKNLIKDNKLDNATSTVATTTNSSTTNATNTREVKWSESSKGLHLGFWKKIKNWLGFDN